jgi:hypothetical protein
MQESCHGQTQQLNQTWCRQLQLEAEIPHGLAWMCFANPITKHGDNVYAAATVGLAGCQPQSNITCNIGLTVKSVTLGTTTVQNTACRMRHHYNTV